MKGIFEEIKENLAERMAPHIDSRCATTDEVCIAWLVSEIERLMPETKCVVCKNGITDNDWQEVKSDFEDVFARADYAGMDSLTEHQQVLVSRKVHAKCYDFLS